MAEVLKNRVRQTCRGSGTGDLDIGEGAAVDGFRKVSDAYSIGESGIFVLETTDNDYEVFRGARSDATTLTRTTVIESTNSNAKLELDSGQVHYVFCDLDAAGYVFVDSTGVASNGKSLLRASTVNNTTELASVAGDLDSDDAGVVYFMLGNSAQNDGGAGFFRWDGSAFQRLFVRKLLKFDTITSGDATPSVANVDALYTDGTTTITNFDDGTIGQEIIIFRGDSDITLQHSASLDLGGQDRTLTTSAPSIALARVTEGSGSKWIITSTPAQTILDEDDFSSDSATNPPSQQSVKAYFAQVPNHTAATELTISSGSITPTIASHIVDTEDLGGSIGQLATDDLDTIVATNFNSGYELTLAPASGVRTVVLKHGTGNIVHPDGVDTVLDSLSKTVRLRLQGSSWYVSTAGGFNTVADYTALKAISSTSIVDEEIKYVDDLTRGGWFKWNSSDLSAEVAIDTGEFVYIPPTDTSDGSSGAWVREAYIASNEINLDWGGAAGDADAVTPTDDTSIISTWISTSGLLDATAIAIGKRYLVDSTVNMECTYDLNMVLIDAMFVGSENCSPEIMRVDFQGDRDKVCTIRGEGRAGWDCDIVPFGGTGVNQGSGLTVQRCWNGSVSGCMFTATDDYTNAKGDVGLGLSDVQNFRVFNNYFSGHSDEGIYATGTGSDSVVDNGRRVIIENNVFLGNSGGVSVRRDAESYLIANNIITDGHTGIKGVEAGDTDGGEVVPPREMQIIGNKVERMLTRGIEVRGITAATVISNNQIHDVNGEEGVWPFINLLGASKCLVIGNALEQRTYNQSTTRGITINDWTLTEGSLSTDFDATDNYIVNNTIDNVNEGIYDLAASANSAYASNNIILNTTTPYTGNVADHSAAYDGTSWTFGDPTLSEAGFTVVTRKGIKTYRSTTDTQSLEIEVVANGANIRGFSDKANAKKIRFDIRTNDDSSSTGGELGFDVSINGTEHFNIRESGTIEFQNQPSPSDWATTDGTMFRALPKDWIRTQVSSIATGVATSVSAPDLSTWPSGIYTFYAIREGSTGIAHKSIAIIGPSAGSYRFNEDVMNRGVTATFSDNSGDLEFTQSGGTTDWQFQFVLEMPLE